MSEEKMEAMNNDAAVWEKLSAMMENKEVFTVQILETVKAGVVTYVEGEAACIGAPKLVAKFLLDRLFGQLGLDKLCATLKHSLGLIYDLAGFIRLLIFGRILQPASKWETAQQNEQYFAPLADVSYPHHIYDALDVLAEHKEQFIRRMHSYIG